MKGLTGAKSRPPSTGSFTRSSSWMISVSCSGLEPSASYARGILDEVVGSVAALARAALDEHVVEGATCARGLPHSRVHDDGRVEADHVLAHVDHAAPPLLFYVPLHLDAKRPVVVGGADAAVDLRALVHEAPALAEGTILSIDTVCDKKILQDFWEPYAVATERV